MAEVCPLLSALLVIIIIIIIKIVHEAQNKTHKSDKSKRNTLGYSVQTDLITVSISMYLLARLHSNGLQPIDLVSFDLGGTDARTIPLHSE